MGEDTTPDPVTAALAEAARLHAAGEPDAVVLSVLPTVVDALSRQLSALQDQAIADANTAMAHYRRFGDEDSADRFLAYLSAEAAVKHADAVTEKVIAALELLAADVIELTGPALRRLEQVVAITDELLQEAQRRTHGDHTH